MRGTTVPFAAPTRLLAMGDRGVLVEVDGGPDAMLTVHRALEHTRQVGVVDLVPAACTVLVTFDPAKTTVEAIRTWISARIAGIGAAGEVSTGQVDPVVVLSVCYDGQDLTEVADLTGLTPEGVVAAHTGTPWRVAFTGFAPGFAYLVGGDPRLAVPRRATPRPAVPAGAVGLAGQHSGVYPRRSPGGWQLIGHTEQPIWDLDADPPALLQPGMSVRFVAVGST